MHFKSFTEREKKWKTKERTEKTSFSFRLIVCPRYFICFLSRIASTLHDSENIETSTHTLNWKHPTQTYASFTFSKYILNNGKWFLLCIFTSVTYLHLLLFIEVLECGHFVTLVLTFSQSFFCLSTKM